MMQAILTKLKITAKRLLGKCVYAYVYLKNSILELRNTPNAAIPPSRKKHKNSLFNFIVLFVERWRFFTIALFGFIAVYYGLGAAVSSKINNALDAPLAINASSPRYTAAALLHVLKTQVDDSPWTPALPAVFPAAVLDNLPNFQLGAKDSVRYFVKRMARFYGDKNLKEAGELLDYPADIWLFSQTGEDRLAPGSAKQYRKALAKISDFAASGDNLPAIETREAAYMLSGIENLLERQLSALHKHVLEHNSELLDFKADDIFYRTKGCIYAVYYMLSALSKDHQDLIVETGQYENITATLSFLGEASTLSPASVKNAAPGEVFAANHLLYLGYYLARAQNYIKTVHNSINTYARNQMQ